MTRLRIRNLMIVVAVLALLMGGVETRSYPSSVVSLTAWGSDFYWRGYLFASVAKEERESRFFTGTSYRVTVGSAGTNVEFKIRIGSDPVITD
jgi:hypothetical protein